MSVKGTAFSHKAQSNALIGWTLGDTMWNQAVSSLQGPCIGNQQSLAHSRLWDAVVGFLHVFANMQMKLSQVLWLVPLHIPLQ